MSEQQRVVRHLNEALHTLFAEDDSVYLIGEDILDPYGGAFKVCKGLSTAFPDRVIGTPLSEGGFTGFAAGLSLMGDKPIVEMMFCDFVTLAYDQIINFISKSVTMYGRVAPMNMIVRCPYGGYRGYGPTHSQALHKCFIGFPNLSVWEINAFIDIHTLFQSLLNSGVPAIVFEHKLVYGEKRPRDGVIGEFFRYEFIDATKHTVRVHVPIPDGIDFALIVAGGQVSHGLAVLEELLIEREILGEMFVLTEIYPLRLKTLAPYLDRVSKAIVVVEEASPGGGWSGEVLAALHRCASHELIGKLHFVTARDSVIPSDRKLEKKILPDKTSIKQCIERACAARLPREPEGSAQNAKILLEIIDAISAKNPMHGKKLHQMISKMDNAYFSRSHNFLLKYKNYLNQSQKSLQDATDYYLKMCDDFVTEQANFERTGRYSISTFAEAEANVYSNPEIMEYYMHGLLLSQFLWAHHYQVLNFFMSNLTRYEKQIFRYLEIGCGHGLYLNAATELLGEMVQYQALDISETSIEMARHFVSVANIDYIVRNLFDHEEEMGLDMISAGEIIEHLEEPVQFLDKVHELLLPRGLLFITVPVNAAAIDHIYLFESANHIREMLSTCGFQILQELEAVAEGYESLQAQKMRVPLMYAAFARKV